MSEADVEALNEENWRLHLEKGGEPYVARIEGSFFDISPKDGFVIHPDPWLKRLIKCQPV
ncbi:MAG: hypothetical protein AAF549_02425 [Pseudomonadota bacterium]